MMAEGADGFTIRKGTVADAPLLAALAERTFVDTFAHDNDPADMTAHVAHSYGVAQQTAELADLDRVTLIGETAGQPMAYAQVRRGAAPPCVAGPSPVELQRFYVERGWHGRGVARQLMEAVVETGRSLGAETLWLGVWERNARAMAFYAKCGFVDVGSQEFRLGGDLQTDRVFARPLTSAGRGTGRG